MKRAEGIAGGAGGFHSCIIIGIQQTRRKIMSIRQPTLGTSYYHQPETAAVPSVAPLHFEYIHPTPVYPGYHYPYYYYTHPCQECTKMQNTCPHGTACNECQRVRVQCPHKIGHRYTWTITTTNTLTTNNTNIPGSKNDTQES